MTKKLGTHIILELWDIQYNDRLDDMFFLQNVVRTAVDATKTTLVEIESHKFSPTGLSCIAILKESHISIHTWPDLNYAAVDIYTCGNEAEPENAIDVFVVLLGAKHKKIISIDRGLP